MCEPARHSASPVLIDLSLLDARPLTEQTLPRAQSQRHDAGAQKDQHAGLGNAGAKDLRVPVGAVDQVGVAYAVVVRIGLEKEERRVVTVPEGVGEKPVHSQ